MSQAIALGLHEAIAGRISALARRVGPRERVVFAGGGALNPCLRQLLGGKLNMELTVPDRPQTVGALGAALIARGWARADEGDRRAAYLNGTCSELPAEARDRPRFPRAR